jgi:hypothetical protein
MCVACASADLFRGEAGQHQEGEGDERHRAIAVVSVSEHRACPPCFRAAYRPQAGYTSEVRGLFVRFTG